MLQDGEISVETFDGLWDAEKYSGGHHHWLKCYFGFHKYAHIYTLCEGKYQEVYGCISCTKTLCIHDLGESVWYVKQESKYLSRHREVCTCSKCGVRLMTRGHTSTRASREAWAIINKVLGLRALPRASGFHCEFPVAVSMILDEQGEAAAERYAEQVLNSGVSSMEMLWKS